MRTLILVVATCFVLSLGYMAYWWMQPAHTTKVRRADKGQAALPLAARDADRPYGPGKNVWVKKFDPDTAKLASRFKADDYQPRSDGWIVVKQPRAQFFMKDGRTITIEGDTGEVIMDDNKKGMQAFAGSRDTPSRGRLYNVTIHLYHEIDRPEEQLDEAYLKSADEGRPLPGMTITLNNASFDNQTFKIYSEGYGRGKSHVDADQVPVKLVGDDYLFDGRGLVIRWNERDRRLQLLEVAHGEQLTILHPNAFMKKEEPTLVLDGPLPVMLAAKGRQATSEAIRAAPAPTDAAPQPPAPGAPRATTRRYRPSVPKPKITPNTDPPLYRATFHDNVKIVQGADLNVTGNRMMVDFLMQDQEGADAKAATPAPTTRRARPATAPGAGATTQPVAQTALGAAAAAPAAAPVPATQPTTVVAAAVAPGAQAAHKGHKAPATTRAVARRPHPATAAASQPSDDDPNGEKKVVITWTGKLTVEPLSVGTENPIKNGDAVIRIEGAPVVATQQGSTIYSGTLTYLTEDQAMLLTPMGPDKPVVMKDTKGSLVHTTRMDFFQPKHQAILYGSSDALFPQEDDQGKASAPLFAKWTKTCTLYFASKDSAGPRAAGAPSDNLASGSTDMNIERAELEGNVAVDHPQLKLRSEALELTFDTDKKATTRPTTMASATTRPVVNVAADRATAQQRVEALERQVSQIDAQIASAQAELAKGDSAQAEALKSALTARHAERESAVKQMELAQASQPRATTGPSTRPAIRSDLKQLVATGTVHCEMTDSAKKTQTIDCNRLTLQTATAADGKIYPNTVNADGEVHAVDPDQDLRAGHLAVNLRPSTQPSKNADGGANANAELQSLVAHQNVKVVSKDGTITLSDQLLVDSKDGKNNIKLLGQPATIIDKKSTLTGPIIEIFPDTQRLQVVGGGNMKGVQQEKPTDPEKPIDVTWVREMVFDGRANTVDVTGQVVAITKDSDGATNTARGERVKMLLADATPTTRPTTQATTQASATTKPVEMAMATSRPTTGPASRPSQYGAMASKNVRRITFDDKAEVSSLTLADDQSLLRRTHLEAATVQYDMLLKQLLVPVEGRMIVEDHRPPTTQAAGGTEAQPAASKVDSAGDNNRGSTAFQWTKQFTYDDAIRQAVMTGDLAHPVVVVHRDDSPKGQLFRLTGDTVTADLEEAPATPSTTQPTTKPAASGADDKMNKVQMKRVTATGHLHFTGPGAEINALYMEYDPKTHWLTARGNENERVEFSVASQGSGRKLAENLEYNLDTGQVRARNITIRMNK